MSVWRIEALPFHVGTQHGPTNGPLPDELPFTLGLDERLGLLVQMPDAAVQHALDAAYAAGSQPGTPMSEAGAGRAYLDDFLGWVQRIDGRPLGSLRVLEVGAGSGALLVELARRGVRCVGVDPAPAPAGLPPEVTFRSEPFRADAFDEPFDLILHFTVLEHIGAPDDFLREQLRLLAPGGRIVGAVPDCEPALRHGDLSMLFHEHLSYFTAGSIETLSGQLDARLERVERSTWGGLLYASWTAGEAARRDSGGDATPDVAAYRHRAELAAQGIRHFAAGAGDRGFGVFVPGRFVNYLALLGLDSATLRFFDDDASLRGRYYPPFPVPVEDRAALAAEPVDRLLVASWSFGARIGEQLRSDPRLADVEIATFEDLL